MEDRLPRKLAAILYADVAAYSRLTGEDEDATHYHLRDTLVGLAAPGADDGMMGQRDSADLTNINVNPMPRSKRQSPRDKKCWIDRRRDIGKR